MVLHIDSDASHLSKPKAHRYLTVLCGLAIEITQQVNIPDRRKSLILCTVFEDNNGALILAANQRLTNMTNNFHLKRPGISCWFDWIRPE
jgi:hypothetical protein